MSETLGSYDLVRHLATGGMAEIWLARQSGPGGFDRELAIKRILPHLAREKRFVSMFLDEARIASGLRHPNIVQIYELGEADGEFFIAMEYIEGADLADLLDEAETSGIEFPIAISVRIIADILAALDFAHDFRVDGVPQHIVHRDVSPHNVLIGTDGIIKLVDFGIAHAVERHAKTETGLVKGKLSYMAPEQIEQAAVDRRADVFAAGVLLYELLTNKPPFGRELAAVNQILNDDPDDPRLLRPDLPDELVPILFRALEKEPGRRYPTAQAMLEDLEEVLRSFDKYVSPKHVARFAERLLAGQPLEGYDDVSQAVPRKLSRRAFVEATTATDTPAGLPRPTPPTPEPPALKAKRARPTWHWALPTAFLALAAVGLVAGALAESPAAVAPTAAVRPPRPAPRAPRTIEPEEQLLVAEAPTDEFTFDEEDLALAALTEAIASLTPADVERMLVANFERTDEQVLWSVRGPHLLGEFTDPPEAVDPGDPRAVFVLRLDELEAVEGATQPVRAGKRKRVRRRPKTREVVAPRKVDPQPKPKVTAARTKDADAPRSKKKARAGANDLRIIETAVPY